MREGLLTEIKKAMQPLADRFGLRVKDEVERPDFAEAVYVNNTTGVSVSVDWSEFRPFVRLHELVDGELPPEPLSYATGPQLQTFDADDLLIHRAGGGPPVGKMLGERDNYAAARLLAEYARALEQHATDVLSGDFTVCGELDRIVRLRARGMTYRNS
jgi:hypothetical protein